MAATNQQRETQTAEEILAHLSQTDKYLRGLAELERDELKLAAIAKARKHVTAARRLLWRRADQPEEIPP